MDSKEGFARLFLNQSVLKCKYMRLQKNVGRDSFISFLLSGDPLTHERRAMPELDALALTAAQKANHPDVHQGHFVQVQHDGVSIALHLRPEDLEMFRLDPTAERKARVVPFRALLNSHLHSLIF